MSGLAGFAGVGVGLALSVAVLQAREARYPPPPETERLLYVRSAETADRLALTFDALAADVYWIRAIQHYGRDLIAARRGRAPEDPFALLQPLLDLTTTLDPHFSIAYRFGSIFLSMEPPAGPGRPDQAIALLEKGLDASPERWQYAYDLAFVHYWRTGDDAEAARWFEIAAAMPDAPGWLRPFAALALAQSGRRQDARVMLAQMLDSPEAYIRNAAERALAQLHALDTLDELTAIVEAFHAARGRYPVSLEELFGGRSPADATGTPFAYDPVTHEVSLGTASPLAPLPKTMGGR
jgi:tetratricopeptide (TPR) repeat protein